MENVTVFRLTQEKCKNAKCSITFFASIRPSNPLAWKCVHGHRLGWGMSNNAGFCGKIWSTFCRKYIEILVPPICRNNLNINCIHKNKGLNNMKTYPTFAFCSFKYGWISLWFLKWENLIFGFLGSKLSFCPKSQ